MLVGANARKVLINSSHMITGLKIQVAGFLPHHYTVSQPRHCDLKVHHFDNVKVPQWKANIATWRSVSPKVRRAT